MLPIGSVGIAMGDSSAAHDLLLVLQDRRLVVLDLLLVRQYLVELPLVLLDVLLVPQDALLVLEDRPLVGDDVVFGHCEPPGRCASRAHPKRIGEAWFNR